MYSSVVPGSTVQFISYPDTYPAGEPQRRCPDLTKAAKDLGYDRKGRFANRACPLCRMGARAGQLQRPVAFAPDSAHGETVRGQEFPDDFASWARRTRTMGPKHRADAAVVPRCIGDDHRKERSQRRGSMAF